MFQIFTDRSNERSIDDGSTIAQSHLDFDERFTLSPIEVMSDLATIMKESLGSTLDFEECFTLSPIEAMSGRSTIVKNNVNQTLGSD